MNCMIGSGEVCDYCGERWDCPVLRSRGNASQNRTNVRGRHPKPPALAAQVRTAPEVSEEVVQSSKPETGDHMMVLKLLCQMGLYLSLVVVCRCQCKYWKIHEMKGLIYVGLLPLLGSVCCLYCPIPAVTKRQFEYFMIDCVWSPYPSQSLGLSSCCPATYPLSTVTSRSVVKALTQFIASFGIFIG